MTKGNDMKRWLLLMTLVLLYVSINPVMSGAQENGRLKIGDDLPGFFLTELNGTPFFIKEHLGDDAKIKHAGIIFSFCASWCKPCKKEIPELEKLQESYAEKGIATYLIAVGENKKKVSKFIEEIGTSLPVLVDRYRKVHEQVGRPGLPYTIFVDSDRKVRYINTGFSEKTAEEILGKLENEIKAVIATDSGDSGE